MDEYDDEAVEGAEEEVDELEKPGSSTRYPTVPPITIMTIIAKATTPPANPCLDITLLQFAHAESCHIGRPAESRGVRLSVGYGTAHDEERPNRRLGLIQPRAEGTTTPQYPDHISTFTLTRRSKISESSAYAPTNFFPRSVVW